MSGIKGLRDFTRTIAAGAETTINVEGDYYHVLEATSTLQISFDDGAYINRQDGMGGRVAPYRAVKLRSTAAQTISISLGTGELRDSRASFSGTVNTGIDPANVNLSAPLVSVGAGATVLLAAADALRLELRVGVAGTEANGIYIGDIGTTAGNEGGYVEVGSTDYLNTEAAVYAYNPGAAAVNVNVLSLRKV